MKRDAKKFNWDTWPILRRKNWHKHSSSPSAGHRDSDVHGFHDVNLWGQAAAGDPKWMRISRQPSRPEEGLLLLWKLGWPVMALADRAWMEVMPLWSTTCFQEDWQLPPWSWGLSLSVGHPAALLKAPSRDALKLVSRRQPCLNSWPSELWNTMKWLLFKASEFGELLLCCNA